MNKRSLLATPYIVWIIGFTVLPILMIVFYALGDGNGGFTLSNILAIFDRCILKSLLLALWLHFTVYSGLSFAGLSAGCDTAEIEYRKKRIDGYYRDSSDVGKLCTAYYGLAVVVVQKRNY